MRPSSAAERHVKSCCFLLLLALPWLAMVSAFEFPADLRQKAERKEERVPWAPHHRQQIGQNSVHRQLISSPSSRILADNTSVWGTLDGSTPLVISHGGSSGLFPDQTLAAYIFAATFSLHKSALTCDLQLTKDGYGICRTGIDLSASTTVNLTFPRLLTSYNVNGVSTQGFFSIDLTASQVLNNLSATQSNPARSPFYDGRFAIEQPSTTASIANGTLFVWINVEYANFFSQHKLDMPSYVLSMVAAMQVDYISSPEIAFLKAIKTGAPKNTPNLVLKFRGVDDIEPSTNVTYGSLLKDLKTVATYASGIMVPKEYIWPVNSATLYLGAESKLIEEAHAAGLAIYASTFVNDPVTPIYNYSFDPIREYLQYVPTTGSNVDGFLTDFAVTASEALACYRGSTPAVRKTGTMPFVISHNGDSGDYPGCTLLAYNGAVRGGASYIDCPVQMTSDGVAICRESPNLLTNTDVAQHSDLMSRLTLISQLQSTKGLYSFNLTWAEIQGLNAMISSPEDSYGIERNPAYTQESILSLSDYLSFMKNNSAGIFIDIQNGYFLEMEVGLDVVNTVLDNLNAAGLNTSNRVMIQSEDSAVLRRLQQVSNYTLVFSVTDDNVVVTATEVAEVKALANYVTLPRGLVQLANTGYLMNKTNIVDLFHAQNVSVFIAYVRNEFVTIPYDYESDPTLELNTLVQIFQVDGLVADFPATVSAYLSNNCLNLKTQTGALPYAIRTVTPGELLTNLPPDIPAPAPAPVSRLNVSEGEAALPPTLGPRPSPTSPQSRAPTTSPSSASSAVSCWLVPNILVLVTALATIIYHF
eukprot:c25048_g2_i1 orf=259-2700(-)